MVAEQISGCGRSLQLTVPADHYTILLEAARQFTWIHICGYNGRRLLPSGALYKEEEKTVSQMKKIFSLVLVVGLGAVSGLANSQSAALTEEMKARIAPIGSVCKSGESCAAAPVVVSSGPKSGKDVYDTSCTTCHAIGVAGAPKTGSADDWAPRIGKGIETLYTHAIEGFNGMPPMGLCGTCTEDEIKAAVDYLVEGAQ